jgi:Leucine-rich repeat (LRR) protein
MSNLPKLVTMSLQGNSFKIMPELNLPSLTSLDFYYVNI